MTRRDPEASSCMGRDRIDVDLQPITNAKKIYLMLNKPRGIVTTASDEKGRDTVYSCLEEDLPWLAPVGRLDKASEGLLLLTNDSEWGARIADPESHLPKTYHVQVSTAADSKLTDALTRGVLVKGIGVMRAKTAKILRHGKRNSWLAIVLEEGKNRQIRCMLETLGIEVLRLVRVAIGPLELGELAKGAYRRLTKDEIAALRARGTAADL